MDGSLLLAWRSSGDGPRVALSRIRSDGVATNCAELALNDIALRDEGDIPKLDIGDQVAWQSSELIASSELTDPPEVELADIGGEATDICRFLP